uniref:Uncharacterized protein n=1 Tax=Rhipicephalus microplus TaxID=6941 RepID=A0A6G5AGN8_RHIMP
MAMSSANRSLLRYSSLTLIPNSSQSRVLKTSCQHAVNSIKEIVSLCLTSFFIWILSPFYGEQCRLWIHCRFLPLCLYSVLQCPDSIVPALLLMSRLSQMPSRNL